VTTYRSKEKRREGAQAEETRGLAPRTDYGPVRNFGLAFLRERGCHAMQGWLLARPLDAEGFARFVRERL
jgi:hypothetical protein